MYPVVRIKISACRCNYTPNNAEWIKSWSTSSEHSCGLYACTRQSRHRLWIYLTLLDSHLLHCMFIPPRHSAWRHVSISFLFFSASTICLSPHLQPSFFETRMHNQTLLEIEKHLPNLWPLEQIEQILSQSFHVLLSPNPNRELRVTGKSPHM